MKRTKIWMGVAAVGLGFLAMTATAEESAGPTVLFEMEKYQQGMTQMPDGALRAYYTNEEGQMMSVQFSPDGLSLSEPRLEFEADEIPERGVPNLYGSNDELHALFTPLRFKAPEPGGPTGIGITRMIDIWHTKTTGGREAWEPEQMIWEGYTGAMMDWQRLSNGRIVVPFGEWVPGRDMSFPTGSHITTVVYSDDNGETWTRSESELTSPCYPGYNGNNYGGCEPNIIELEDGRLWMLFRTQTGRMWESYSDDDGTTWTRANPSRFYSSTSPADFVRLPDGRIVFVWNNYEMPPRVEGQFEYGGRDSLHAAISDDDGKTWRGFREIYRDVMRNETPPRSGDRGTAYPRGYHTETGTLVIVSGQGEGRRNISVFDPDWLTQTHRTDDFSKGLDGWIAFKPIGPPRGAGPQRDRILGPEVIAHRSDEGAKVLHVRRPNAENAGDGAAWNFPMGWSGTLSMRLMLQEGSGEANIALGDRCFNPTDNNGEKYAQFNLPIEASGQLADGPSIEKGRWYDLELAWNLDKGSCVVRLDGEKAMELDLNFPSYNGISYLRLRSLAEEADNAGLLVDSVEASVADTAAPEQTTWDNQRSYADYRDEFTFDSERDSMDIQVDVM